MRQRFMFWLDHSKPQEEKLVAEIENLKKSGMFARTIRDGIRLMNDLRAGKTDVLQELFPWVLEQVSNQAETSLIAVEPLALQKQVERLEHLFAIHDTPAAALSLQAHTPARESEPEIEIEVKAASKDEDNNPTWNFLLSSALNVYGTVKGLPPEVIEYGIRTNRIPRKMIENLSHTAQDIPQNQGPKPMQVPDVAPPSFEDLTLEI